MGIGGKYALKPDMQNFKYNIEEFTNMGFDNSSPIELEIELGIKDTIIEKNSFVFYLMSITCERDENKILNCLKSKGILHDMYRLASPHSASVFNPLDYSIKNLDELSSWVMKQILFDLFKHPTEELYFIIREKNNPSVILKRTFVTKYEC